MVLRHCDGNFVPPHFNLIFRSAGTKHNTWIYAVDLELKCKNGTVRKEFAVQGAEWIRQPQGRDLIHKKMTLANVLNFRHRASCILGQAFHCSP